MKKKGLCTDDIPLSYLEIIFNVLKDEEKRKVKVGIRQNRNKRLENIEML